MTRGGKRPSDERPAARLNPERVPPHSEEYERGLLGCILLDSSRVLDLCAERRLTAACFYNPVHQTLFEVLSDMETHLRKVDLLTAASRLRDLGRLDEIGGDAFLQQLVDQTPTVEHAAHYIDGLLEKHIRRTIIACAHKMAEDGYTSDEDAMEVLARAEQSVLEIGQREGGPVAAWDQTVKAVFGDVEVVLSSAGSLLTGVSTGFRDLDRILLGLQRGDMVVLAARPSMGKTSLAMNIAENVAHGRNPHSGYVSGEGAPAAVAVFSLEMSRESLVRRMLCSRAGVSWQDIVRGFPRETDHQRLTQAADALMKAPFFVDDTPALSVLELRARARRLKKMHDVKLIVIDYLQMMRYPQFSDEGLQRETKEISGAVKAMAKELRVPVLVLSQLNRQSETRDTKGVPKLSDLRDSGSIEQDADVVLLLRRPIKNRGDPRHDEANPRLAIVDVAKQRNGSTGEIDMIFDEEHTCFKDGTQGTDAAFHAEPSTAGMEG